MLGVTDQSVNYLLNPPANIHTPRHGAAIMILVLYAILILLMGLTYFRLLYTVTANPGYVPVGARVRAKRENELKIKSVRRSRHRNREDEGVTEKAVKPSASEGAGERFLGNAYMEGAFHAPMTVEPAPGLSDFYNRDVFVCQGDGRPIWCSTCENWKPDRAHHCREIDRCVRKMDHFCPW